MRLCPLIPRGASPSALIGISERAGATYIYIYTYMYTYTNIHMYTYIYMIYIYNIYI